MAITNKLKSLLDQPVWEWTRFNVTPGQTSAMTARSGPDGRYLYSINGQTFTRFDSFTDTFQILNSPPVTVTGLVDITYKAYDGYYARAISGTTTTINGSFFNGKICKGKKIRILEGTNDGQERTIVDVSDPVVVDTVVASAVNTTSPVSITDNTKNWTGNQWRGYQYRIISGNAKGVIKKILYNSTNTLYFADGNYLGIEPRMSYAPFKSTPSASNDATKSIGVIEYQTATLDTPLPLSPDGTTKYLVIGGAVWLTTASSSTPFYQYCVYDILSDEWYLKSSYSTFFLAQMGGTGTPANTISLERIGEYAGSYLSGGVVSSTLRSITDSSLSLTPDRYANYQLRLDNGQTRTIKTNTSSTFTFYRDMDFLPVSGTSFNIFADNDKIFMSGAGLNVLSQYSIQKEAWTQGEIHDYGNVRNISVQLGYEPGIPVTLLTFFPQPSAYGDPTAVGYVTGNTGSFNNYYKFDDTITIKGVTPSIYNKTVKVGNTNYGITSFSYPISSVPSDTSISNTDPANCIIPTTVVLPDVQKNWNTNEHRGKILFVSNNSTTATTNSRLIYLNSSSALSSAPFASAHTIGSKYHIQDIKSFGSYGGIGTTAVSFSGIGAASQSIIYSITGVALSSLRTNMPIYTRATTLTAAPYARIIGVDAGQGYVYISSLFGGTGVAEFFIDERTTQGYGVSNTICAFRENDIPISISTLTHSALIVSATTTYPHGYTTGDLVTVRGVSTANAADALYMQTRTPIVVTGPTTFTYVVPSTTGTASATPTTTNSTTQLVDASKNWPTNIFSGARCRIVAGTGAGQEFTINTNSAIALQFTAITTAPDTTSVYAIYPNQPRGIGTVMRYVGNNSNPETKGKYLISVRGGNTSNIEKFNITTSEWEFVDVQPLSLVNDTLGPGTVGTYDGDDRFYLQKNVTHRFVYLDVNTNEVVPWGQAPNPTTPGTINNGNKCEVVTSEDGLKYLYFQKNDSGEMYRTLLFV